MEKKPSLLNSELLRFSLYFLALLPLLLLRDVTPDNELKYLSIADEALRDGHLWCLFNHGVAYADKPPLYIWIIMLFRRILGFHCIPVLELFSLISAFVILHIFNRWTCGVLDRKWALAAELGLLTSAYFAGAAIVLRMDMLMMMFICLSMYSFWLMYNGDMSLKRRLLFPVYVFMAIFTKGPVGIMVPLFCIPVFLIVKRRFRLMGRVWGLLSWGIIALLCAVWWTNVYLEGGRPYLDNLLFHQTVDRAVDAFHHKQPFYYYLWSIWYAMAPWCLITIPATITAAARKVHIDDLTLFFLLTGATIIVMMSIVSSKLVIYILPAFAFITYGAAILMQRSGPYWACKVIRCGSTVMLALFLAAGCLVVRFNDRIGLREVCREASAAAADKGICRYGCFNLKGGENLDVYLGLPVESLSEDEMTAIRDGRTKEGIIIFTKGGDGKKGRFEVFTPLEDNL